MGKEIGWKLENSYEMLSQQFYSGVSPTVTDSPKLVMMNEALGVELGFNVEMLKSKEGIEVLAGNHVPKGAHPLAQAYAGHQFGHFTMLGDGRAILLGEQITVDGRRVDIQLKGAGRTPYSRGGDGRATLGPMLREYIISEAMHGLGIPTTRSLAVIETGEAVLREEELPGAILTRIASSHLRVGTFQYASAIGKVKELADYTIARHFPEIQHKEHSYRALLQEVINRQASLIAKWQLVGFVHGVMNTDNVSISGETIDYGPCAFMDIFDLETVFSSIDRNGRYAYGNQPGIGKWNLVRFAEALLPILANEEEVAIQIAEEALAHFAPLYEQYWLTGMRGKLGIFNEEKEDKGLMETLLDIMTKYRGDYTNIFRGLTLNQFEDRGIFATTEFKEWYKKWQERLTRQEQSIEASKELMRQHNPAVIPRNHRVEEALEAAVEKNDYTVMHKLLDVLANPYAYSKEQEAYATLPTDSSQPYRTFCGT